MSRGPRISYPGAFYHIISRGIAGSNLFQDDEEFLLYLYLLKKYTDLENVRIHSYTLLNTHSHMIVKTPFDNISSFMKSLNISYATRINKKRIRKGHLFAGRFQSIIVDSNKYLVVLSRYVHINQVVAGIVKFPEDYKWSSYRYFVGKEKAPDFLDTDLILSFFNYNRKKYQNFVIEGIEDRFDLPPIAKFNGVECYGNPSFAKKTIQKFERRKEDLVNKKRRWSDKGKPLRYNKIISIVLSHIDNAPPFEWLVQCKDNQSAFIKRILAYFLTKYSDLTNGDISNLLGYKDQSAISIQLRKIYDGMAEYNSLTKRLIEHIEKEMLKF